MDPREALQAELDSRPRIAKHVLGNLRELLYTAGEGGILPFNQLEDCDMQTLITLVSIAGCYEREDLRKFRM